MFKKHTAILSLLFLVMPIAGSAERIAADMVLTNGRIYTVDARSRSSRRWPSRMRNSLAVGSAREIQDRSESRPRHRSLAALCDAGIHRCSHPPGAALSPGGGRRAAFPREFRQSADSRRRCRVLTKSGQPYIVGEKWSAGCSRMAAQQRVLDSLISDRPPILRDETRHGAVANTAMAQASPASQGTTPQPRTDSSRKTRDR